MTDLSCSRTNRKRSGFAMKHFQRKPLKIFRPSSATEKVSIICGVNNHVKSEMLNNRHTDRQTDTHTQTHRPSTVTLAVHVRRGLIGASLSEPHIDGTAGRFHILLLLL